jgi:hypothetical protein
MWHTSGPQKRRTQIYMTTINTTLLGDGKQAVAFRLPITVWHEEQMVVLIVDKTKQPSAIKWRCRQLAFVPRLAHLKSLQREAKANQLKERNLCGLFN